MKSQQQQIDELKATVDRMARELSRVNVRNAKLTIPKQGWWLGILTSALSQGSSAVVRIWWYSDAKFRDSQLSVTAYDWFLNTGESIPANTKVRVDWYHRVWVITNAYCDASDLSDLGMSPALLASPFTGGDFSTSPPTPDYDPITMEG